METKDAGKIAMNGSHTLVLDSHNNHNTDGQDINVKAHVIKSTVETGAPLNHAPSGKTKS